MRLSRCLHLTLPASVYSALGAAPGGGDAGWEDGALCQRPGARGAGLQVRLSVGACYRAPDSKWG